MTLQDNVKKAQRQARGMTQEQLGQQVGVTRQTIIAIEKGGYAPAIKLARALGARVEALFWLDEGQEQTA